MSFANTEYLIYAFLAAFSLLAIMTKLNSKYFKWIKTYWFYDRTFINRVSGFFYFLSIFLLIVSLLDLRGPEKKMKSSIPDQRTIILIDTSTSMLSEDVRPSRFVKSLQIARHFVKNAVGHQISIVLFSDIQKRLVPFTDDLDLLDSRLAALEKTNTVSGGSNVSQAIAETVQYFESSDEDEKTNVGNLLVFTDAEESEGEFKAEIPSTINLAIVGVGTSNGGNIPLRYEDGGFKGYKSFKGEQVITKLDEAYIKKMGSKAKNFKYWVANSYSLPTEEILNFFRATFSKSNKNGDVRVRPVYSHYILIPAIFCYAISVVLSRFPVFKLGVGVLFLLVSLSSSNIIYADEKINLEKIKTGKASRVEVLKKAEELLKNKEEAKAEQLYFEYEKENDSDEIKFNSITAKLKSGKLEEAISKANDFLSKSKNENLKNQLRSNLLVAIENSSKQKNKNDKKKDNQNNQDQNKKDGSSGENKKENQESKGNGKDSKGDDKNQGQQKNPGKEENKNEGKEENKKDNENKKDKDKKDSKDKQGKGEEKEEENQPQNLAEKEKQIEQRRKMVKTPAMIKQILNDDRELQKKMMDTSTIERAEMGPKKDW